MFQPMKTLIMILSTAMVLVGSVCSAIAAENGTRPLGNKTPSLLLLWENDIFTGTDELYTNGVKVTWISRDEQTLRGLGHISDPMLSWIMEPIDGLSYYEKKNPARNVSVSIGQNMYNPTDVKTPDPDPHDRPYAGWLYTSIGTHSKDENRLDSLELSLGVIGPWALGEEAQNTVHRLKGIYLAEGWDHQLHNEPGIMLTWLRSHRIANGSQFEGMRGWGEDLILRGGATVGNVQTYATLGGEIRLGYNLPYDFGTSIIAPGGGVQAPVEDFAGKDFGFHLFMGVDGRAVARDIFLDGNTFRDSPSVTKVPFVADFRAGFVVRLDDFSVTYTTVLRTPEFIGQRESHTFGSLGISYQF